MSTTRYKIRLWEYDGEASVANAVTFDSFDEAQARFNDLRVSEEMPCVEFIKERIANGCIISDEVLNVRQFASVFDTIVFGYIAFVRNRDKDKESNVKHDATVLTEIGYIKANTDEIKAEQREQRKTNTEFVTRLTNVEASAKQAHKRLDHIEQRIDQAE